jgi:hypothetical protein
MWHGWQAFSRQDAIDAESGLTFDELANKRNRGIKPRGENSASVGKPISNIRNRNLINLVSVLIDDGDEPPGPIPSRHNRAVFEIARERQRIVASGSIAREVNTFVVVQNLFAVGEMEIVTRHGGVPCACNL